MSFLDFIVNPQNLFWIDLGILFLFLLILLIVFILDSIYFHYLFSISFIVVGFLLLFYAPIANGIVGIYDQFLEKNNISNNGRKVLWILKFSPLVNKILFFVIIILFNWVITTPFYFLLFKKKLKIEKFRTYKTSVSAVSFVTKSFIIPIIFLGVCYFITPLYNFLHNHNNQSLTYVGRFLSKTKINQLINKNTNSLKPILQDIKNLQNNSNKKTFFDSLLKIDTFFVNKYSEFHKLWWKNQKIANNVWVKDLVNKVREDKTADYANNKLEPEYITNFIKIFDHQSKEGFFLFLNKDFV